LAVIRCAGIYERLASWDSTNADLWLCVYRLRHDLRAYDDTVDWEAAARDSSGVDKGRSAKRRHMRERSRSLPRRG
jgi:hypothetical protein